MCSVCDAGTVLDGAAEQRPVVFQQYGAPSLVVFGLPCAGAEAEFAPFRVLVQRRRRGERATIDQVTGTDLAGFLGALGTDIKWDRVERAVGGEVAVWLDCTKDPPAGADLPRRLRDRYDWQPVTAMGSDPDVLLGVVAIDAFDPPAAKPPKPPRPRWQRTLRRWWWALSERVEDLLSRLDRRR